MIKKIRNIIGQWFATKQKTVKKWEHRHWFRAIIGIILLSLVMGGVLVAIMSYYGIIKIDNVVSVDGLLRAFVLGSGAIAGLYALRLAIDRQEKFSEQVQVQIEQTQVQVDQSFNDKLGRGIELLAKENVVMRTAGVSVLVDLANNANEVQKPIVASIIYDFFRNKLVNKPDTDRVFRKKSYQDVKNALDFLIDLPLSERKKLFPNRLTGDRLNFSNLDFSYLNFNDMTLESIDFSHAKIKGISFAHATIKDVNFSHAIIEKVNFWGAKIENSEFGIEYENYMLTNVFSNLPPKSIISDCDFNDTEIINTTFCNINIESSMFSYIQLVRSDFHNVEFWRGNFCHKQSERPMDISSDEDLPHFIGTDLGDSNFQFANAIESNKFFKFCYASMNEEQSGITPFIDESRAYEPVDLMNVFIKSDKPWSEQPADEWVAVEVAEWIMEQNRKTGEDIISLDPEWSEVTERLRKAQERLRKLLKEHENKPKPKKP